MSTYGLILLASISIPFLASFHPKIKFYKNFKQVLITSVITGIPFLIWDSLFSKNKIWEFNSQKVSHIFIAGMPIEELLFFLVIPFCCLLIYEIIQKFIIDKKIIIADRVFNFIALACVLMAILFRQQTYTVVLFIWLSLTLLLIQNFKEKILSSQNYWLWIAICYLPFLIVNGLLTGIPVVIYQAQQIWGIRIFNIPLEDFFYNWSLLSLNLAIYKILKKSKS